MSTTFLHGVEVQEITSGAQPISTVASSVIGLVGFGGTSIAGFPANTPVLVTSATQASVLTANSYLAKAINAIFTQGNATVVVVNTTDETVTNIAGSATANTGIYALKTAASILGVQPRILVADLGWQTSVAAALTAVSNSLRAVAIIGLDSSQSTLNTATQATAWVTANGSMRTYTIWPFVTTDGATYQDPAPFAAGLISVNDNTNGFWWSPSNKQVFGISGLQIPVDFSLGDSSSLANVLNAGNVATIINLNGYKLWGNHTGAGTGNPTYQFLSVRRTADLICDSIQRAHLWAVDRNITKTYLEDVSAGVNQYLSVLKNLGAILGGTCWPDPNLNTATNIANGIVYFDFTFTPPYPAEHVIFQAILTNSYVSDLLTLTS